MFKIPLINSRNYNYTHTVARIPIVIATVQSKVYLEQYHKTKSQYFKQKTAALKMYPFWLVKGLLLLSKRGTFAY